MSLLSFVHEDIRIVRAINKLANLIEGLIQNFSPPISYLVGADSSVTTNSVSFVLMPGMTVTPSAGTYLVTFSGEMECLNSNVTMGVSIWSNNTIYSTSERYITDAGDVVFKTSFCSQARIQVNGSQAIEGRWKSSNAAVNIQSDHRQLTLIKVI